MKILDISSVNMLCSGHEGVLIPPPPPVTRRGGGGGIKNHLTDNLSMEAPINWYTASQSKEQADLRQRTDL
jgi:hypothetical protein